MTIVNNIVKHLFVFFCFFPFIGINLGTDMQPMALLFAILLIILDRKLTIIYKKYIGPLIAVIVIMSAISIFFVPVASIVKRLFSYASVIIIFMVSASLFSQAGFPNFEKVSKIYHCIWALVGAIQILFSRNFLTFLVPLSRTTASRGVCSLASEPSFYGYMCLFFFVFALSYKKNKYVFCALAIIQVLLFAQSAVALLYFVVFTVVYAFIQLISMKPKHILSILFAVSLSVLLLHYLIVTHEGSRLGQIVVRLINEPQSFFISDASAASRIKSIIKSFSRAGIPTALGTGGNLLHSGFGSVFYELGFFSLLLYIPVWKSIYNGYSDHTLGSTLVITITICMLSGIQLSLPLAAMYYGMCEAKKN